MLRLPLNMFNVFEVFKHHPRSPDPEATSPSEMISGGAAMHLRRPQKTNPQPMPGAPACVSCGMDGHILYMYIYYIYILYIYIYNYRDIQYIINNYIYIYINAYN